MSSAALHWWKTQAKNTLDDMKSVHAAVGGHGRGRRYTTGQVNNAYAVLLLSQFQKFCRDLHSEAADHIANHVPHLMRKVVLRRFTEGRKLDSQNPNPGNLGSDFGRFGLNFWKELNGIDPENADRNQKLAELSEWRNAIGHHDFFKSHL